MHMTLLLVCRAKFITSTVQQLLQKPQGGEQWLLGLRGLPYSEAVGELCSLCGVGPKVGCILCTLAVITNSAFLLPVVQLHTLYDMGAKVGIFIVRGCGGAVLPDWARGKDEGSVVFCASVCLQLWQRCTA